MLNIGEYLMQLHNYITNFVAQWATVWIICTLHLQPEGTYDDGPLATPRQGKNGLLHTILL